MEALKELLVGEGEDGWGSFEIYFNSFEEQAKTDFIETLNII